MKRLAVALSLALLLAGCALAPEGTSLDRMYHSLYHVDHPEYERPITQAAAASVAPRWRAAV